MENIMQQLVVVYHSEYDNCAVPIIVEKIKLKVGDEIEERGRSRPYVFQNHRAQIPFKYFPLLVEQRGDGFIIEGIVPVDEESLSEQEKEEYTRFKRDVDLIIKKKETREEREADYSCPFCGKVSTGNRSRVSLIQHVRHTHKDEYEAWTKENKIGKFK